MAPLVILPKNGFGTRLFSCVPMREILREGRVAGEVVPDMFAAAADVGGFHQQVLRHAALDVRVPHLVHRRGPVREDRADAVADQRVRVGQQAGHERIGQRRAGDRRIRRGRRPGRSRCRSRPTIRCPDLPGWSRCRRCPEHRRSRNRRGIRCSAGRSTPGPRAAPSCGWGRSDTGANCVVGSRTPFSPVTGSVALGIEVGELVVAFLERRLIFEAHAQVERSGCGETFQSSCRYQL